MYGFGGAEVSGSPRSFTSIAVAASVEADVKAAASKRPTPPPSSVGSGMSSAALPTSYRLEPL